MGRQGGRVNDGEIVGLGHGDDSIAVMLPCSNSQVTIA